MIYSSLAVLALTASAAISPFSNPIHLHPRAAQPDSRIALTLHNNALSFRDVKIDGKVYIVPSHEQIDIKAPAGTIVYANSTMPDHRRGDVLFAVTPQLNNQKINLD